MSDTRTDNKLVLVLAWIVYAFIFVFGLVGNLRVGCSALRLKSKQKVTNLFIVNLTVANVFLCLFVLPTFPVLMITNSWALGEFMCHMWPFVYHSVCYSSVLTLASMSLFRCWTIVISFEETITRSKFIVTILVIWSVSMLISLPRGMYKVEIENFGKNQTYSCQSRWPSDSDQEIYLIATFIITIVVPLFAIFCFFTDISSRLSYLSTLSNAIEMNAEIKEHRRTNRLILYMAIVFGVCWMPIKIYELVSDDLKSGNIDIAFLLVDAMAMSWTCFAPLFYAWLNHMTIKQLFVLGRRCNSSSSVPNSEEVSIVSTTLRTNDDSVTYNAILTDDSVTYNAEVGTVDIPLPTYDDAVTNALTPPPTYGAAITYHYHSN